MQGLKFIQNYEGKRVEREFGGKAFWVEDEAEETDDTPDETSINLNLEIEAGAWEIINPQLPKNWRMQDWASRPVRFVDGKDVGQTVAWLRGTDGSFVAIRLAEIGSVVMKIVNGELRREFAQVERVLAMNTAVFPWEEIESFALALREHDIFLLPTKRTPEEFQMNFEKIRKYTQRRSAQEMMTLEEFALAQRSDVPTVFLTILRESAKKLKPDCRLSPGICACATAKVSNRISASCASKFRRNGLLTKVTVKRKSTRRAGILSIN